MEFNFNQLLIQLDEDIICRYFQMNHFPLTKNSVHYKRNDTLNIYQSTLILRGVLTLMDKSRLTNIENASSICNEIKILNEFEFEFN